MYVTQVAVRTPPPHQQKPKLRWTTLIRLQTWRPHWSGGDEWMLRGGNKQFFLAVNENKFH